MLKRVLKIKETILKYGNISHKTNFHNLNPYSYNCRLHYKEVKSYLCLSENDFKCKLEILFSERLETL
ncbi:MAG: hypothetical protein GY714_00275 [Desulfobacterales bacterium]|nr:hypothetical protein [Desulfobacterales bacterium]MCP4159140.1 hypothetical protein [Deltaproteobacteria bacterium]